MKYVALLRAINVGGRTVKMSVLAGLFDELGFAEVETFIASGNVVFESRARSAAALERTISEHLRKRLGYDVATFLRTPAQLQAIAEHEPFPAERAAGKSSLYVAFAHQKVSVESAKALAAAGTGPDAFAVRDREVYWRIRGGFSASTFSGGKLEKLLNVPLTVRNISTVQKLARKYGD